MAKAQAESLDAFITKNPPRTNGTCWACQLPQIGEIERAYASGKGNCYSYCKWLVESHGYDPRTVSAQRLNYHFKCGHARKPRRLAR